MTDLQDLSIEEAKALIQKQAQRAPSKYRNKKTAYNGRVYDSKREADYARELDIRQKAGDFESWEPQVKFPIFVNDTYICTYVADFVIYRGNRVPAVREVKGVATPVWKLKRKLLAATHPGLELRVVR